MTLSVLLGAMCAVQPLVAAEESPWRWQSEEGKSLALTGPHGVVWKFNYGAAEPKPYFHPVAMPDGRILTWNRPPDHDWHHGMWFSWKYINRVNYWEPADRKAGTYAGRTVCADIRTDARTDGSARITSKIAYHNPQDTVVLTEVRTVAISVPDETAGYQLDWTATFTAGEQDVNLDRTPLATAKGGRAWGGYAGLSFRFAKDLADRQAISTQGPATFTSDRARPRSVAADYNARLGDSDVGVAMIDHPENPRHPTPWYLIRGNPMSYMNAALLTYEPLVIPAGKSMTLRYRVVIHPQRWDAARLESEHERFAAGE